MNLVIKVADFGLSETLGTKNYFRQGKGEAVKLPLRWLAPESIEDFVFSEKSDVVSSEFTVVFYSGLVKEVNFISVGLWRDVLGDIQWRESPLSNSEPTRASNDDKNWTTS